MNIRIIKKESSVFSISLNDQNQAFIMMNICSQKKYFPKDANSFYFTWS